jgi:hypothetical protein
MTLATKKKATEKFYGTGRRKKSIARVYLMPGKGEITINKRDIDDYFGPETEEYKFEKGTRDYYLIIDEVNRADVSKVFGDVLFALDEDYRGIENRFDTRLSNLKAYHIVQADDIGKANYSTSHIGFAEQMKFDCFENGFFLEKSPVLGGVQSRNRRGGNIHHTQKNFRL